MTTIMRNMVFKWCAMTLCSVIALSGCRPKSAERPAIEEVSLGEGIQGTVLGKETLSEYGFFTGPLRALQPAEGVIPYELNAPLFSDYAFKKRFIALPKGAQAVFSPDDVLDFPEGTVLIKNFYYPADFRKPEERIRILETRLLILEGGEWQALPYIWNAEQTEAYLDVAGKNLEVQWTHADGRAQSVSYSIPNMNQCKGCHMRGDKVMPIGPTIRQLNRPVRGHSVNQLAHWSKEGWLQGLPPLSTLARLASYEDASESLDARARAWLEVNCAHCHRSDGPAKTSGLHLLASTVNKYEIGVGKAPVAAGRGSGGLKYSIVPGKPDASILYYRINSDDPGVMMPELGRKLIHEEGVALIREWIQAMQ